LSAEGQGRYSILWDGKDDSGANVASGTYFGCLRVDGRPPVVQRMTVVR